MLNKKRVLGSSYNYCKNDESSHNTEINDSKKKKGIHIGEYRYASTDELKQKLLQLKQNNKLSSNKDTTDSEDNSDCTFQRLNNANGSQQTLDSNNSFRSINSRTPSPVNKKSEIYTTETMKETLKPPIVIKSISSTTEREFSNGNPVQTALVENIQLKVPIIKFRSVSNSSTSTSCNTSSTTQSKSDAIFNEQLKHSIKYVTSGTNTEEVQRVSVATNTETEFHSIQVNTDDVVTAHDHDKTDGIISIIKKNKKKLNIYLISTRFIIVLLKSKKFTFSLENTIKKFIKKTNDKNIIWNDLYLNKIRFGLDDYVVMQKLYNIPKMITYPGFDVSLLSF